MKKRSRIVGYGFGRTKANKVGTFFCQTVELYGYWISITNV